MTQSTERLPSLTEAQLEELVQLGKGGINTALEWRAAALAAHPFLLAEVREARKLAKEINDRLQSFCEYKCDSRVKYHTPTCLRGKLLTFLGERSDRGQSSPPAVPDPVKVQ